MAMRIELLGGVVVRSGGRSITLESARAASLLGYLLVHRGAPQPRQRLAFAFWPDSTEAQARTNLRHVLHTLRRALPEADGCLEVTAHALRWRTEAPYTLDLADFERALAEDDLERAVDLYAGDLMEGVYDPWVLEAREELRDRYLDALERLAREHEARGAWASAVAYGERLVRHDPLHEEGHRALMRLHDLRGDRVRALRVYQGYAATLLRELGLPPPPATRAVYEALLLGDGDPRASRPGASSPAGPPFVGRAPERARLTALWRAARSGRAQLVLVSGEPGIGKSRLVEELRGWCAHGGALTAEARAYPAEGAVAYGPVVAWLRSPAVAARLRRLEPAHLTELARLLPELEAELPDLARPEPLPEPEQRRRLFAAIARVLVAPGPPFVLVADDLQWFDPPTLQFLHYLLRAHPAAPLLVAATARHEEMDPDHPVRELVAGLGALERFSEVALGRLSHAETDVLAEAMRGEPLAREEADRLFAHSEGNPLFVVEAAQAAGTLPEAVRGRVGAVIAARLARLSEAARELAGVAATIGREFSAGVLADASGMEEGRLVSALDELWRRGVVRARALDLYDFSHGRVREAAYAALAPAQRRRHHGRVARALERAHGDDLDGVSGLLAAQYEAAGAVRDAVRCYERAADAAQRLHAHPEAARALERALALCGRLPANPERDARELAILTALPAPLVALHGYRSPRLVEVHERALALARALAVEPEAPLVRSVALAALTGGRLEEARALGEELRARGERTEDDVLLIESLWVLGVAAYWDGRPPAARAHLEAALAAWRPERRAVHLLRYGQDPELVCSIRLAHAHWLLGDGEEARRLRDRAVALAEAGEHPYSASLVALFAALIALDGHDEAALRAAVGRLAPRATGPTERPAAALLGFLEVLDGGGGAALERVVGVVEDGAARGPAAPGEQGLLVRVLLEACAVAGDAEAGLAAADAARRAGGAQPWGAEVRRLRAVFLHATGAPWAQVQAELRGALAEAEGRGALGLAVRVRETLARLGAERPGERLGNGWSPTMPLAHDNAATR